ncbi:conserved hypothetical protein [Trichinella spiralis]|uniref:hypothetical protein n=1 Tax=Trichinella spiralis TaxID=6334 RepID=UPI0001EFE5C2|nr:conserved hypothetical protein [Trichinella spiralis]
MLLLFPLFCLSSTPSEPVACLQKYSNKLACLLDRLLESNLNASYIFFRRLGFALFELASKRRHAGRFFPLAQHNIFYEQLVKRLLLAAKRSINRRLSVSLCAHLFI